MFEILDEISEMETKQAEKVLLDFFNKHLDFARLLKMYICDEDRIITVNVIYNMMKYYKIEHSSNINKIGEIGEFTATRINLLKVRNGKGTRTINNSINIESFQYLIDVYKKLKVQISSKNQYKILRNCFMILKPEDVKWFTRIICRKIIINKAISESIKKIQIDNELMIYQ